jgi:asparagine synthase (glutamine-hydrolysing)
MCGIAGVVSLQSQTQRGNVQEALARMIHRGPDAQGIYETEDQLCMICFARLTIVGFERTVNQPFESLNREWVILFNGEIYNYLELAKEFSLIPKSDGEVLPYVIQHYGLSGLRLLRGMFALFIHNNITGLSYLVRDGLGIKPLYYHLNSEGIVFASEVRALSKIATLIPDRKSFINAIEMGHFLALETGFKDTFRVLPGELISIDAEGRIISKEFFGTLPDLSETDPVEAFLESVNRHIETTVDSRLLLSGGFDSAAILWASRELGKTLESVTLKLSNNDELQSSLDTSEYFDSPLRVIDFKISNEVLDDFLEAVDLPSYDGFQLFYLHKVLAGDGVRVTITGHGADEVFLKYSFHKKRRATALFRSNPIFSSKLIIRSAKKLKPEISNKLYRLSYYNQDEYKLFRSILPINSAYSNFSKDDLAQNDFKEYLAAMSLADLDQYSMANSIEARVPFLDLKFIESIIKSDNNLTKSEFAYQTRDPRLIEISGLAKNGFGFQSELIDSVFSYVFNEFVNAISNKIFVDFIGSDEMERISSLINLSPKLYIRSVFQIVALERWFSRSF